MQPRVKRRTIRSPASTARQNGSSVHTPAAIHQTAAWPDFIRNQLQPFGTLPVYLAIGNHEVVQKTRGDYVMQFGDWLTRLGRWLREQAWARALPAEPYRKSILLSQNCA